MAGTAFPARRSLRGTWLFVISLFVMACFGALLLVSGESLGWWFLGFSLALEALVIFQAWRPGWSYAVGVDGITVSRTVSTIVLPLQNITSVEAADGSRLEELLAGPQWAAVHAGQSMNLASGIRARRELSLIVSLCTAPVVFTQTKVGGPRAVRTVGARAHGRFVIVSLRDGSVRAISPVDVDGFVAAWSAGAGAAAPAPALGSSPQGE